MKLTPLGKRLYVSYAIAACTGLAALISFILGYVPWTFIFLAICVGACVNIFGIGIDANVKKYGLWGRRCGADPIYKYEPGDPEYEEEKRWQGEGDIEFDIHVDIRTTKDDDNDSPAKT